MFSRGALSLVAWRPSCNGGKQGGEETKADVAGDTSKLGRHEGISPWVAWRVPGVAGHGLVKWTDPRLVSGIEQKQDQFSRKIKLICNRVKEGNFIIKQNRGQELLDSSVV